MIEEVLRV